MKSSTKGPRRFRRAVLFGAAVATAALITSGCSAGGGTSGNATLVIWDQQLKNTNGWSDLMSGVDSAFEQAHPGVKIDHVGQTTDSAAYTQLLQAAFQAGSGPDVIMMQPANDGVYIYADALTPLDGIVKPDVLKQVVGLPDTTVDGKVYGIPSGIQSMVVYYNKALFAKAGLDPEAPPTDFKGLMDAAKALKAAGITPFAGGNGSTGDLSVWVYSNLFPELGTTQDALDVGANKIKFTDPVVVNTLQEYVDIYKEGYFDSGVLTKDLGAGIADFSAGTGAMSFNIATLLPYVADGNGDSTAGGVGADNLGVIPRLGDNYVPVGAAVAWTIPSFSKNQQLAADYISELSSTKTQQAMFDNFGWLPANTAADTSGGPSLKYPAMKPMLDVLLKADKTQLPAHQWWKAPVATEYKKQMQAVLNGSVSLKDALAAVQAVQDQQ
ncbi:extracellular solute-binding protein [soil metagenome]